MTAPEQDPRPTPTPQQRDDDFETAWEKRLRSRELLREVMTDDELREFGINVDELDRKPEAEDLR